MGTSPVAVTYSYFIFEYVDRLNSLCHKLSLYHNGSYTESSECVGSIKAAILNPINEC